MVDKLGGVVGGLGLFAAVLGFTHVVAAPDPTAASGWGALMAFGVAAFAWSAIRRRDAFEAEDELQAEANDAADRYQEGRRGGTGHIEN